VAQGARHSPRCSISDQIGQSDGGYFDENPDTYFSSPVQKIRKIFIYHGEYIFGLTTEYQLLNGSRQQGAGHGGPNGGNLTTIEISDSECLYGIEGVTGPHVGQLTFIIRGEDGSYKNYGPFGRPYYYMYSVQPLFSVYGGCILSFGGAGTWEWYIEALSAYYYR